MAEGEQAPEAAPPAPPANDPETEALRKRIREAFDLFDKEGRGTVVQEWVARPGPRPPRPHAGHASSRGGMGSGNPLNSVPQGGVDHYAVSRGVSVRKGHGGARPPRCARFCRPHGPRALGHDAFYPQIQEDEPTAFVTYEKFERKMLDVLCNSEYPPDSSDVLLQAFRVLDTEKKGYITAERMEELLSTKGTPFREKEMESASRARHPAPRRVRAPT